MAPIFRRDFLKLCTSALGSMALSPFLPELGNFDDAQQVRVASKSISIYKKPNVQSLIVAQRFRDELVNSGTPTYNPIWYRVWGGYLHRGRTQRVKTLFNKPLSTFAEGTRQLAEITVPLTQAMRYTKTYG